MKCCYLDGDAAPFYTESQRNALVGKRIEYLRPCDIDHSGRGYLFPQIGIVESVLGINLCLDDGGYVSRSELVELRVISEEGTAP